MLYCCCSRRRPAVDEAMVVLDVTAAPVLLPDTPLGDCEDVGAGVLGVGLLARPLTAAFCALNMLTRTGSR